MDYEIEVHSRLIWFNGLNLYTKQEARKVYCLTIIVEELHHEKQYQNIIKEQLMYECGKKHVAPCSL